MENDIKKHLKNILPISKSYYDSFKKVYCSCLKEWVVFNSKGFHHLRYHVTGRPRKTSEQLYKIGLLPLAIPTIKYATICDNRRAIVNIDRKGIKKEVEYWSLTYKCGKFRNVKVKVILRRIGNGKLIFWSIMKLNK